jgi:hypothetical protein
MSFFEMRGNIFHVICHIFNFLFNEYIEIRFSEI